MMTTDEAEIVLQKYVDRYPELAKILNSAVAGWTDELSARLVEFKRGLPAAEFKEMVLAEAAWQDLNVERPRVLVVATRKADIAGRGILFAIETFEAACLRCSAVCVLSTHASGELVEGGVPVFCSRCDRETRQKNDVRAMSLGGAFEIQNYHRRN